MKYKQAQSSPSRRRKSVFPGALLLQKVGCLRIHSILSFHTSTFVQRYAHSRKAPKPVRNPTNTASPLPDTSDDRPKPRKLPRGPPPPPAAGGRRTARRGPARPSPTEPPPAGQPGPHRAQPPEPGLTRRGERHRTAHLPRGPAAELRARCPGGGRQPLTCPSAAPTPTPPPPPRRWKTNPVVRATRWARPRRALIGGRRRRAEAGTALPSNGAAGARPYLRAPGRGLLRGPPRSCAPARPRRRRLAPRPLTCSVTRETLRGRTPAPALLFRAGFNRDGGSERGGFPELASRFRRYREGIRNQRREGRAHFTRSEDHRGALASYPRTIPVLS